MPLDVAAQKRADCTQDWERKTRTEPKRHWGDVRSVGDAAPLLQTVANALSQSNKCLTEAVNPAELQSTPDEKKRVDTSRSAVRSSQRRGAAAISR